MKFQSNSEGFLLNSVDSVDLVGIEANGTREGQIMVGEQGRTVAKNISNRILAAVEKGNLSLNVSGTLFVANRQSINISEPKSFCTKGQAFREGYCCKYYSVI